MKVRLSGSAVATAAVSDPVLGEPCADGADGQRVPLSVMSVSSPGPIVRAATAWPTTAMASVYADARYF